MHAYLVASSTMEADRFETALALPRALELQFTVFEPFFRGRDPEALWAPRFRPIRQEACSVGARYLFVSYEKLFEKILRDGHEQALVLQSDALLLPGWEKTWRDLRSRTDLEGAVFLGSSTHTFPSWDRTLYTTEDVRRILSAFDSLRRLPRDGLVEMGVTRCAEAVVLTRRAIATVLPHLEGSFSLPLDHHLSRVFRTEGVKAYWLGRPMFCQGSEVGVFDSHLRPRKSSARARWRQMGGVVGSIRVLKRGFSGG